jgi:hypothetical protein
MGRVASTKIEGASNSCVSSLAGDYPKPPDEGFGPMDFAALRLDSHSSLGRFGLNPPGFSTSPKNRSIKKPPIWAVLL